MKVIPETPSLNFSCNFVNPELKNEYLQYRSKGKSNEIKLTFGRNPLIIYQELADWLVREKVKLEEGKVIEEEVKNTTDFCDKLVDEMNEISYLTSSFPVIASPKEQVGNKRKKKSRTQVNEEHGKKFKCEVCEREGRTQFFQTGQGLGGHMSRVHKGKSEKFNRKKEIRNKREDFRKILYQAKKIIIGERFDSLNQNKSGKLEVKKIIRDNRDNYRKLVRELRKASSAFRKSDSFRNSEKFSD